MNKQGSTTEKNKMIERWAWIIWFVLALSFIIVYFHRVSLAVVMDHLMIDLNITDAAVAGTLAGMYSITYLIMQIPSGVLADFWGARKTVTSGTFLAACGSLLFALAPNIFLAFLGRIIVGVGVSVVYVAILKFNTAWFKPNQFATMTGLTVLSGNLGGAIGTTPTALLVTSFGWRNSFLFIGIATFIIAALCWFVVKDTPQLLLQARFQQAPQTTKNSAKKVQKINYREIGIALKDVMKNRDTWPLFMSIFGVYGTMLAFSGAWSITYLMQIYGLTRTEAANYMLAVTLGMIVGCPLIGYISDKTARRKSPHLLFFTLYLSLWVLLSFWNNGKPPLAALYPIYFLMGLAGSLVVTIFSTAKEVNNPAYAGVALGFVNVGSFAGISILQPLFGYILDLKWEGTMAAGVKVYPLPAYQLLFATCLITLLICYYFAWKTKETKCQNIFSQDVFYRSPDYHADKG